MKTNCLHTLMKMSLHASGVSRNNNKKGDEKENMRRGEKEMIGKGKKRDNRGKRRKIRMKKER